MAQYILNYLLSFEGFIIITDLIILILSDKIISYLDTTDLEKKKISEEESKHIANKQILLRVFSIIIIGFYLITIYIKASFLNNLVEVSFVILVIFLVDSFVKRKILIFYGDEIEISGETYLKGGYKTNIFSLLTSIISIVVLIFLVFKIFGIESALQSGGVIAGILAFTGFTAPVWAPDMIASIMILHNGEIETGNVVEIKEEKIFAWVKSINLSEVKLIDMVYNNPIILRPSHFRNMNINNLSNGVVGKRSYIPIILDVKLDYKIDFETINSLVIDAYKEMKDSIDVKSNESKYFILDKDPKLEISEFQDDNVLYKLTYYITSPFYIIRARRLFNFYLLKHQKNSSIYFSTPSLVSINKNLNI